MGTTLTGTTPQDTYDSLIKVTDNGPISGTAKFLSDGLGNDSVLALSTARVGVNTNTPQAILHTQNLSAGINTHLQLSHENNYAAGAKMSWFAGNNVLEVNRIENELTTDATTSGMLKFFSYSAAGGLTEKMRITGAGNAQFGDGNNFTPVIQYAGSGRVAASPAYSFLADLDTGMFNPNLGNTIAFATAATERMRIAADGEVSVGSTNTNARFNVSQTSAARITGLIGNSNSQGSAQNYRVVRHYPVVSLGTKLIIPFVSQGSLNCTTFVRVFGHNAAFNDPQPVGFTADFGVGSLTSIQALQTISSTGNTLLVASNGASAIEITFTSGYGGGVFVTLEYMTNNAGFSIDVANITMN